MKKYVFVINCLLAGWILSASCIARAQEEAIIQVEVKGSGRPLILIHGMNCSADVWKDVAEYYASEFAIHLVHINGFGNKRNAEGPVLERVKDDLIHYIVSNGLKDPVIMGHSMGAFLGFWVASESPGSVGALVAVDGLPYFPVLQMPGIDPESAAEFVKNMEAMQAGQTEEMRRMMSRMYINSMIATESKKDAVVEMGMASNPEVTNRAYGEMFTTDLRPEMDKIECPVLLLGAWYGYRQYGATYEGTLSAYKAQVESIPQTRVAMAEKAYHFIFYDEPDWFFDQVNEFLGEIQ